MNWDEVGAIGQMLGSVAVLISIAYLALQVRHAQRAMGRSLQQSRTELTVQLMLNRASDETFRRTTLKLNSALGATRPPFVEAAMKASGFTEEEAFGLMFEQWAWWQVRNQTILNIDQLSSSERAEADRNNRIFYGEQPIGRLWYEKQKYMLNADAVRYVDNLLAQPG